MISRTLYKFNLCGNSPDCAVQVTGLSPQYTGIQLGLRSERYWRVSPRLFPFCPYFCRQEDKSGTEMYGFRLAPLKYFKTSTELYCFELIWPCFRGGLVACRHLSSQCVSVTCCRFLLGFGLEASLSFPDLAYKNASLESYQTLVTLTRTRYKKLKFKVSSGSVRLVARRKPTAYWFSHSIYRQDEGVEMPDGPITEALDSFNQLDGRKVAGLDGIHPVIVNPLAMIWEKPLAQPFNASLDEGILGTGWHRQPYRYLYVPAFIKTRTDMIVTAIDRVVWNPSCYKPLKCFCAIGYWDKLANASKQTFV